MNIPAIQREYDLSDKDLLCIALYILTDSKVFSWSKTFGINSKSNNPGILASRYFTKTNVNKFIFDNEQIKTKGKKDVTTNNVETFNASTTNKDKSTNHSYSIGEITSDNIKQMLEQLIHQVDDPKDKLAGMIKVAEYVGLNKTDIDLTTPTIYLPQRCNQCEHKPGNK
jgi:hypothetical protein